ncbi:Hypothetical predicted protein, partial [Pelobates cultripes]
DFSLGSGASWGWSFAASPDPRDRGVRLQRSRLIFSASGRGALTYKRCTADRSLLHVAAVHGCDLADRVCPPSGGGSTTLTLPPPTRSHTYCCQHPPRGSPAV